MRSAIPSRHTVLRWIREHRYVPRSAAEQQGLLQHGAQRRRTEPVPYRRIYGDGAGRLYGPIMPRMSAALDAELEAWARTAPEALLFWVLRPSLPRDAGLLRVGEFVEFPVDGDRLRLVPYRGDATVIPVHRRDRHLSRRRRGAGTLVVHGIETALHRPSPVALIALVPTR